MERVTVLVGMSNSLYTALAIKLLTHLEPLHKDYTTLHLGDCSNYFYILMHAFVTKQDI